MADVRSAWNDTGDRLAGLGAKLKLHYAQQRGDEESHTEVKEAVKRLAEAVQDSFDAMGSAVKDPAIRADVKQVGQSLTDALGATFSEVSGEVRKAFRKPGAEGGEQAASSTDAGTDSEEAGGSAGSEGPQGSAGSEGGNPDADPPRVEPWGTP